MAEHYPEIAENIRRTGVLPDDASATLRKALDAFKAEFKA